jgi:hypothetical protein
MASVRAPWGQAHASQLGATCAWPSVSVSCLCVTAHRHGDLWARAPRAAQGNPQVSRAEDIEEVGGEGLDDRCGHVRGRAGGLPRPVGGTPQLAGWLVSHGVFAVGPQLHPTTCQPPSHARSPLMPSTTHACTIIVCCRVRLCLGIAVAVHDFAGVGRHDVLPPMPSPHNTHLLQIIRLKQVDHMKSEIVILTMINHPFIVNLYVGGGGVAGCGSRVRGVGVVL